MKMEEIEYLEEYEDLVLPATNAPQSTVDDGSSSSLDQDIFNCLFDDNSDDDNDEQHQQSKNDETNLNYKSTSNPSLDSIDLLNDLGEQVAKEFELKKDVASQQSQKTYNSTKSVTKVQPKASSKLKPKGSSVRISATTASLPVNRTAQAIIKSKSVAKVRPTVQNKELVKKSGIVKESSTQQAQHSTSFASRTTSNANATSILLSGRPRKILESGTSSSTSSSIVKKSTTTLLLKSPLIKQRPATIVKPEKIVTKDPPEDPLNLEDLSSAESANYSISDISGETYNSITDFDEDDYDFTSHIENLDEDDDDSSNSRIIDISNDSSVSHSQFDDLRASTPSPVVSDDRDLSSTACVFKQRSSSPKFMANHVIIKCLLTKGEKPKLLQLITEHDAADNIDINDRNSPNNTQPTKTSVGEGTVSSPPNELSNEKDTNCITLTTALQIKSTNTKEHEDSSTTCVTNMDCSNNSRDTQSPGTISHDSYLSVVNEMLEESYAEAMKNNKQDGLSNQEVGAEMEIGVDEITEDYLVPEVDISKESSNLEDEKNTAEKLLGGEYPVGAKLIVLDAEKTSETNKIMDATETLSFKANESTEEQVSVENENELSAENKSDVNIKTTEIEIELQSHYLSSKKRFQNDTKSEDIEFREEALDDEDGFQGFQEEVTQNINTNITETVQTEDLTDCYTNVKQIETNPIIGNERTCNDEQGATTFKVNAKKYSSVRFENPTKINDKSKEHEKNSHKNRLHETLIDRSKDTFSSKIKSDGPRSAIRNPFVQRTGNKNLKIEESTASSKDRSQGKRDEDRSREKSGSNSKIEINEEIPVTKELVNIIDSKEFTRSDDVKNTKHSNTTEKKRPDIENKAVEKSCKDMHNLVVKKQDAVGKKPLNKNTPQKKRNAIPSKTPNTHEDITRHSISKEDKLIFPLHKECREQRTSKKNTDYTSKGIASVSHADIQKDIIKHQNQLSNQSSHETSKERKSYNKSFDSTEKPSKVHTNDSMHCEDKNVSKLCGKLSDHSETMATLNESNVKKPSIDVPNVLPQSTKMGTLTKSLKDKNSALSEVGPDSLQSSNESKYLRIDNTELNVSKTSLKMKQTSNQSRNAITVEPSSYSEKSQTPCKKKSKHTEYCTSKASPTSLNKSRTGGKKNNTISSTNTTKDETNTKIKCIGQKPESVVLQQESLRNPGSKITELKTRSTQFKDKGSEFEKVKQQKVFKNTKIISEKVVKVISKEERKPKKANVDISGNVEEIEANRSEPKTHQGNTVKDAAKVKDTKIITDNIVDNISSDIKEALYEPRTKDEIISKKTEDISLQMETTNLVDAAKGISSRKQENAHCSDKAKVLKTSESETSEKAHRSDNGNMSLKTTHQNVSATAMHISNTGENSPKLDRISDGNTFKQQLEISRRDPQEVIVEGENIVENKINEEVTVRSTENNKRNEENMDVKKFPISEPVTDFCRLIEEHNKNEIDEKTLSTGEITTNNSNIVEELVINLDNNNAAASTEKEKSENKEEGNQKQDPEEATHAIRKTRNTIPNPKSSFIESSCVTVKLPETESRTALTNMEGIEDETETNYPQVSNMKTRSTKLDDSDTIAVDHRKEIIEYKKEVRFVSALKKISTKPIPHSSKTQELPQKNDLLLASKSPQINTTNISTEKPSSNITEKSKISKLHTDDFEYNSNWSSDVSKDCGVTTIQMGMRKTRSAHVHDDVTDDLSLMHESVSDVSNRGRTLRKRGTESPANGANKEPFKQPTKLICPGQVSPMSPPEISMKRRLRSPASEYATQLPLAKRSKTDSIPEDKSVPYDNGKCKVMEKSTDIYKIMDSHKKVNHNKGKQSPDKYKSDAVSSPEKSPSCTVLSFAEWLKNNNKKEALPQQKPSESQPNIEEPKVRKRPNRPISSTLQCDTEKPTDSETKKNISVPVAVKLSQTSISSKGRAPLNCAISKNSSTSDSNQSNDVIQNTSETERLQNIGRVSLSQKVTDFKCNTHDHTGQNSAQMNEEKSELNTVSHTKSTSTNKNIFSAEYTKDVKGDLSEVSSSPTSTSRGKTQKRMQQTILNKGITKRKLRVTQKSSVNRTTTLSATKHEKSKCKRSETDILIESMSKEMKDGGIEDLLNNSNHVKRHRISSKRNTQAELPISSDVSFAEKSSTDTTALVSDISKVDTKKMSDGGIQHKSPIKRTQAQEKTRNSIVSKETNQDFIQKQLHSIEMEKALIDEIEIKNMNTSLLEPLKPLKDQSHGTRTKTCPFKTPKPPELAVISNSTSLSNIQSAENVPQLYNETESHTMNTSNTTTKQALLFKCRMLKVRLNRSLVKKYWAHLKTANTPQALSLTEVENNSSKNRRKVQSPLTLSTPTKTSDMHQQVDIVKSTGIENNKETPDSSAHIPPYNHKLTAESSMNGKTMPIQTSGSGEINNILLRTTNAGITEESGTRSDPFNDVVSEPVIPVEFKNEFLDENPCSLDYTILPDTPTLIARAHSVTQAAASALSNAIMPTDIRLLTNDPMSTSTYVPSFGVTPTLVDTRGTRMYTFLHPAKYSRNHGNVLLDYCCPNLDGPMPAIDPTRIHAQVQTPVIELPAFIVLTTKVITKAELENNSSTIPAIIKKKAEKLRSSIAIHHNMSTSPGSKINAVSSSSSIPQTPQLQQSPQSVLHAMRPTHLAPAPHFSPALNALTKYLPSTTTITAKIRPPLPLSLHHPNSNQHTSAVSVIAKGAPLLNEVQVNLLRSNLRRFDVIFKKLVQPFDTLNFTERHQIIDNLVMSGKFLPNDLDRTIVLMEEYSKHINSIQRHQLTSSNRYKMPAPASAPPLTNLPSIQMPPLQLAPNRSSSSYTCTSSQQQVCNTATRKVQATMKQQNTTVNTTTIKQRQVPIYDTERNIIGYQLQVLTPPSTSAYTKSTMSSASGGRMSSSLDASSYNQRKAVKRPAQDSPRVFYTSQPLETSTPKANLKQLQYTASPLAASKNKQAIAESQKGSIVTTVRSAGPTSAGTETITTTTMATVKRVTRSRAAGSKIIIVSKSNSNEESILPDVSHQTEIKNEKDMEDFVG